METHLRDLLAGGSVCGREGTLRNEHVNCPDCLTIAHREIEKSH